MDSIYPLPVTMYQVPPEQYLHPILKKLLLHTDEDEPQPAEGPVEGLEDVFYPALDGELAPVDDDGAPVGYDGAPVGYDRAPVGDDGAPVGYDRAPVGYDRAPVGDDHAPVGYDRAPVGADPAPVGDAGVGPDQQSSNFEACLDHPIQQTSTPLFVRCPQLAAAALQRYDPLWIENFGLDRNQLQIAPSPMKFDKLFRDGVLGIGDQLVVGDRTPGNTTSVGGFPQYCEGALTHNKIIGVTPAPHWLPDVEIPSTTEPSGHRVIHRCNGPQALVQEMMAESPASLHMHRAWWEIRLVRGGADLGILATIRDDYGAWEGFVDEWAVFTGRPRRARRARPGSDTRWTGEAFHKVLPDGSLRKLADQINVGAAKRATSKAPGQLGTK
ncbi:hypothetical protein MMC07_009821 [Pseudocyphellaria aurata]|nr:hypothetical protein [Pseudocyphellaria aurata]